MVYIAIYSYIADTVSAENKAVRMIVIEIIGALLGGFALLGIGYLIADSYFWSFVFVFGFNFLAAVYAYFLIPESVQVSQDASFNVKDISRAFKVYFVDDSSKRRWKIQLLTVSLMVELVVVSEDLVTLFLMNAPLCWDSVLIGYFGAVSQTIGAAGGICGALLKKYLTDQWMVVLGIVSFVAEMVYTAFVQSTIMMYFGEW